MSSTTAVSIILERDSEIRVQRYSTGRAFHIRGVKLDGKALSDSKLSGIVVARPSSHIVQARDELGRDAGERYRPSLSLDFSPRGVGAVDSRGYTSDLDLNDDQFADLQRSHPRAIRDGYTAAFYVPEPFTVNGRAHAPFSASLSFYAHSDNRGYTNANYYPQEHFGGTPGIPGAWVFSTSGVDDGLTDAGRERAEQVARAALLEYTPAELISPVLSTAEHRERYARERLQQVQRYVDMAEYASEGWRDIADAVQDGAPSGSLPGLLRVADERTSTANDARTELNRWNHI